MLQDTMMFLRQKCIEISFLNISNRRFAQQDLSLHQREDTIGFNTRKTQRNNLTMAHFLLRVAISIQLLQAVMLLGASQDKLLITTSIQFMGTKHARANKDSLRISSYNYWQPEEKLSLIVKLFIVFTITLFLNLPQVLFLNAFTLSLIPSLPLPLGQNPNHLHMTERA